MSNLDVLRNLTENLPSLGTLLEKKEKGFVEYSVKYGTCFGIKLLWDNSIAVQKAFMSKGTVFPDHVHDLEKEILIVFKGNLVINKENYTTNLSAGELSEILPGESHSMFASTDTWLIAITIPAEEGYPNGR